MARSDRTFPRLQSIRDNDVRETLRENWKKTYDQSDSIAALQAQVESLQSTVSSLQAAVSKLQTQIQHALKGSGE